MNPPIYNLLMTAMFWWQKLTKLNMLLSAAATRRWWYKLEQKLHCHIIKKALYLSSVSHNSYMLQLHEQLLLAFWLYHSEAA